jgi:ankyrin repeat protein
MLSMRFRQPLFRHLHSIDSALSKPLNRTIVLAIGALVAVSLCLFIGNRGEWLVHAAWTGHTNRAKLFVWLGTDINYYTPDDATALHGAAATGNLELIRFLLQHGANVGAETMWHETPLYWAHSHNQMDAERILIEHGANPDFSNIHPP